MNKPVHLLLSLILFMAVTACGGGGSVGGDEQPDDNNSSLDANVAPITQGDWYRPAVTASWNWQIQGELNTSYAAEIYDIDLFDVSAAAIAELQEAGHRVLCYFSAGSYEDWRDDAGDFAADDLGRTLSGYADERWLDIRSDAVFEIMLARLDLAVSKGCDGVEPDNVTGFEEHSGFSLSAQDQLAFNRNLFNAAHQRGLAVALKNDLEQIAELIDYVDLMVNEQCHQYDECDLLQPFIDAGKPVLNAEYLSSYQSDPTPVCSAALIANLRTLILSDELDDSLHISCDEDFPSTTGLADVQTYVTYYQNDAARIAEMTELDLSIVQPVLSKDQIYGLQSHGKVAVYLSIGEIGLSNTYWYNGQRVAGQVIYDAHPEWFLEQNPYFDSYFADTRLSGWQDFIIDQAGLLVDQGYDGLFMDTVDTVDVYPETIPGMVELIGRLRDAYPEIILVQNRGINVISQTGEDVDALMFEVFNSYFDSSLMDYQATDVTAPGYAELVELAMDYRLQGGVVLSQDFALPDTAYEDLVCYARDRALQHRFIPSYADKYFQDGLFHYPQSCPWPMHADYQVKFDAPLLNVSIDSSQSINVSVESYLGFDEAVTLSLGTAPNGVVTILGDTGLNPGESTTLEVTASEIAEPGHYDLQLTAESEGTSEMFNLQMVVHEESLWLTNAGLSKLKVFDDLDKLSSAITPGRQSGDPVAQPYDVDIDSNGQAWVVENVGDPDAVQPAGRVLRYDRFELSAPAQVFDSGLNYPTGIAIDSEDGIWIANSALDWTGTPRGTPNIVSIAAGANEISDGFSVDATSYGYVRKLAVDAGGNLWMTTTYGLVLGIADAVNASGTVTPFAVLAAVGGDSDFLDTMYDLVFDAEGDLWISGSYSGSSRIVEVNAGSWATDSSVTYLNTADVPTVLSEALYSPWGLDFDAAGNLWVVNATDADDNSDSKGSLLRFDADGLSSAGSPARTIELESRYTLGVAVSRP